MKLAINEKACTLYDERTGQTLTETALLTVIERVEAYEKLVVALCEVIHDFKAVSSLKSGNVSRAQALLRELGVEQE